MTIKHTLNLVFNNFNHLYKVLLYFIIIALLICTIVVVSIAPSIKAYQVKLSETGFFDDVKGIFDKLLNGDNSFLANVKDAKDSFLIFYNTLGDLSTNFNTIIAVVIAMTILFIFLFRMCIIPYAVLVNMYMSIGNGFGFFSNFIIYLKKSAIYSLLSTIITTLLSAGIYIAIFYFIKFTLPKLHFFAFPVAFIIWVVLIAGRNLLFSGWIPTIVKEGKGVIESIGLGLKSIWHYRHRIILSYISVAILTAIMYGVLTIFTFGAGLLLAVPLQLAIMKTLDLVIYYNCNDYNYYYDKTTVNTSSLYKQKGL